MKKYKIRSNNFKGKIMSKNQLIPSVTTPTIAEVYQRITQKKLNLQPDFQRKFVWTQEHIEKFIETILYGYPFPEIYTCLGETDLETITTKHNVIDGQQRLTSIIKYIENDFEKNLTIVSPYKQLSKEQKESFLKYQIVIRDIGDVSDEIVREIFKRINLTKFKLDDIEIHNAVYDGQFIQTAKQLAKTIELKKYGVLYESEFNRMADVLFFLSILSTLQKGYFTNDKEIEICIAELNETFDDQKIKIEQITSAFNLLDDLNLPADSIWFRKSNFFTMIVEFSKRHIDIHQLSTLELTKNLLSFEEKVISNKNNQSTPYGQYYAYMYSGTNSRKARITRAEIFNEIFLNTQSDLFNNQ